MPCKIITKEIEENIINFYNSCPMTIKSLGDNFNLSSPTIIKILDKYNVKRYEKHILYNPKINENYFSEIDDENKAYFTGLILTDGNIFKDENDIGRQASISITLKDSDSYLLKKFKDELKINTSIIQDKRGTSTIAVRSNNIAKDLLKYGITPRKSFNSSLPKIDDSYMSHLIRGILDGDGSVQAKQTNIRNRYRHNVGFCGTKLLMEQIKDYLIKILDIKDVSIYTYKEKSLSMVTWNSVEDIFKIYKYLYNNDPDTYMIRKKSKFEGILTHYQLI